MGRPDRQAVDLSVVYPATCPPVGDVVVEAVLHLSSCDPVVPPTHEVMQSAATTRLRSGARLRCVLEPPAGFSVDAQEMVITWTPPLVRVQFLLRSDADLPDGVHHAKMMVYGDGIFPVLLMRVYFALTVDAAAAAGGPPCSVVAKGRCPSTAFASYAASDWNRVKERVDALGPFMDVFVDCLDIKQGQGWEDVIEQEVVGRDALLLFWSTAASKSRWVDREWRHALKVRGLDYITPNALEAPAVCPPPAELASLQFGSALLMVRRPTAVTGAGPGDDQSSPAEPLRPSGT